MLRAMAKKPLEDLRPAEEVGGASNEDENHGDVEKEARGRVTLLIYRVSRNFKKEQ